ncbi:MAG: Hsp70 family protein [Myxococcota bacterium]
MTVETNTGPAPETDVESGTSKVSEIAWADAVLEGDRPARDSIVPPMFPSTPPDPAFQPVVIQDPAAAAADPAPSSGDVVPPFSVQPAPAGLPMPALEPVSSFESSAPMVDGAEVVPVDDDFSDSTVALSGEVSAAFALTAPPEEVPLESSGLPAMVDFGAQLDALTAAFSTPPSPPPEAPLPIPEAVSELPQAALPPEMPDDPAMVQAALAAVEGGAVEGGDDPNLLLADPSDIVDLETLDQAFDSIFGQEAMQQQTAPPQSAPDAPVISATTGDLTHPPPPVTLRTDTLHAPPPLPVQTQQLTRRREVPMLAPKGDIILGIDLGTTFSCAAIVERRHASVLASRWGSPMIPSVVAFLPDGRTLVGESALRYGNDPRRVIAGSKRIFGRAYHSPIVQELKEHFAYEIVEGSDGDAAIKVDGRQIGLEEVAAAILREIRESAGLQLEGRVNRAVITCPAHFNERQRDAVRYAGELAGFHVERVVSEPTAAALHFGLGRSLTKRKVLVFDLGGGTFDVSLLEVNGDVFEVLGTGGDSFLGGIDFDACIADQIVEAFLEKEQIDARSDPVAIARILQYAERAKRELTDRSSTIVQIDHLTVQPHAPRSLTVPIRRSRVEEMWAPLIEHTATIVTEMLERAEVKPSEVDEVLLVGGQSRTPAVQKRMEQLFGRKLSRDVNPEEAIALGAAQLADSLNKSGGVTLIDVLPMSIGVGLPGGRYKRILERDTKLPAERSYSLRSTRDNQTRFEIVLFQGEDENVDNDDPLGIIELNGLPRGPKGSVTVIINLRVTAQQVLEIQARETKTGKSIQASFGTKHTGEEVRKKMGLPGQLSHEELKARRSKRSRIKGVWSWLTGLFKRKSP